MSLGLKYALTILSAATGHTSRVRIWKDGFVGTSTDLRSHEGEFFYDWGRQDENDPARPIAGSGLRLTVNDETGGLFNEFLGAGERDYLLILDVDHGAGYVEKFRGWVRPDTIDRGTDQYEGRTTIAATDGLSSLKEELYEAADGSYKVGDQHLLTIVREALQRCDTYLVDNTTVPSLRLRTDVRFFSNDMAIGENPLNELYEDGSTFIQRRVVERIAGSVVEEWDEPLTYWDVLEQICTLFEATLFQAHGAWYLVCTDARLSQTFTPFEYDLAGTVYSKPTVDPRFDVASEHNEKLEGGRKTILRALDEFSILYPHDPVTPTFLNAQKQRLQHPWAAKNVIGMSCVGGSGRYLEIKGQVSVAPVTDPIVTHETFDVPFFVKWGTKFIDTTGSFVDIDPGNTITVRKGSTIPFTIYTKEIPTGSQQVTAQLGYSLYDIEGQDLSTDVSFVEWNLSARYLLGDGQEGPSVRITKVTNSSAGTLKRSEEITLILGDLERGGSFPIVRGLRTAPAQWTTEWKKGGIPSGDGVHIHELLAKWRLTRFTLPVVVRDEYMPNDVDFFPGGNVVIGTDIYLILSARYDYVLGVADLHLVDLGDTPPGYNVQEEAWSMREGTFPGLLDLRTMVGADDGTTGFSILLHATGNLNTRSVRVVVTQSSTYPNFGGGTVYPLSASGVVDVTLPGPYAYEGTYYVWVLPHRHVDGGGGAGSAQHAITTIPSMGQGPVTIQPRLSFLNIAELNIGGVGKGGVRAELFDPSDLVAKVADVKQIYVRKKVGLNFVDTDAYTNYNFLTGTPPYYETTVDLVNDRISFIQFKLVLTEGEDIEFPPIPYDRDIIPDWTSFAFDLRWDTSTSKWLVYAIWSGDSDTKAGQFELSASGTPTWSPSVVQTGFYGKVLVASGDALASVYLHGRLWDHATTPVRYSPVRTLPITLPADPSWDPSTGYPTDPNLWAYADTAFTVYVATELGTAQFGGVNDVAPKSNMDDRTRLIFVEKGTTDQYECETNEPVWEGATYAEFKFPGIAADTTFDGGWFFVRPAQPIDEEKITDYDADAVWHLPKGFPTGDLMAWFNMQQQRFVDTPVLKPIFRDANLPVTTLDFGPNEFVGGNCVDMNLGDVDLTSLGQFATGDWCLMLAFDMIDITQQTILEASYNTGANVWKIEKLTGAGVRIRDVYNGSAGAGINWVSTARQVILLVRFAMKTGSTLGGVSYHVLPDDRFGSALVGVPITRATTFTVTTLDHVKLKAGNYRVHALGVWKADGAYSYLSDYELDWYWQVMVNTGAWMRYAKAQANWAMRPILDVLAPSGWSEFARYRGSYMATALNYSFIYDPLGSYIPARIGVEALIQSLDGSISEVRRIGADTTSGAKTSIWNLDAVPQNYRTGLVAYFRSDYVAQLKSDLLFRVQVRGLPSSLPPGLKWATDFVNDAIGVTDRFALVNLVSGVRTVWTFPGGISAQLTKDGLQGNYSINLADLGLPLTLFDDDFTLVFVYKDATVGASYYPVQIDWGDDVGAMHMTSAHDEPWLYFTHGGGTALYQPIQDFEPKEVGDPTVPTVMGLSFNRATGVFTGFWFDQTGARGLWTAACKVPLANIPAAVCDGVYVPWTSGGTDCSIRFGLVFNHELDFGEWMEVYNALAASTQIGGGVQINEVPTPAEFAGRRASNGDRVATTWGSDYGTGLRNTLGVSAVHDYLMAYSPVYVVGMDMSILSATVKGALVPLSFSSDHPGSVHLNIEDVTWPVGVWKNSPIFRSMQAAQLHRASLLTSGGGEPIDLDPIDFRKWETYLSSITRLSRFFKTSLFNSSQDEASAITLGEASVGGLFTQEASGGVDTQMAIQSVDKTTGDVVVLLADGTKIKLAGTVLETGSSVGTGPAFTNIVGHWPLTEQNAAANAEELVNGHYLTLVADDSTIGYTNFIKGSARLFDAAQKEAFTGADTGGRFPSNDEDFWGVLWFRPTFPTAVAEILYGKTNEHWIGLGSDKKLRLYVNNGGWSGGTFGDVLVAGTIYCLQFWYDASTGTLYGSINDGTVYSVTKTPGTGGSADIGIGGWFGVAGGTEFFRGAIQRLTLWRRLPENAAERTWHYNGETPRDISEFPNWASSAPTTATVVGKVKASTDDASETVATGAMNLTRGSLYPGDTTLLRIGYEIVGLRFTWPNGGPVPASTVTSAKLRVYGTRPDVTGSWSVSVHCEDADNPGTFTSATNNITGRTRTTASATFADTNPWYEHEIHELDITTLVQEVLDRAGYAQDNPIVVLLAATARTGDRQCWSYDANPTYAPELHVTYGTGETPTGPTDDDLNVAISASGNDAVCTDPTWTNLTDTKVKMGAEWGNAVSILYWPALGIPLGATIDDCTVKLISDAAKSGSWEVDIYAVNDVSVGPPVSGENVWSRPRTSTGVIWSDTNAWTAEQAVYSPDLKSILQSLVAKSGWSEASGLMLLIGPATRIGSRSAYSYDGASAKAPRLIVNWTYVPAGVIPETGDFDPIWDDPGFEAQFYNRATPSSSPHPIYDPRLLNRADYVLVAPAGYGADFSTLAQAFDNRLSEAMSPSKRNTIIVHPAGGTTYRMVADSSTAQRQVPWAGAPLILAGLDPYVGTKLDAGMTSWESPNWHWWMQDQRALIANFRMSNFSRVWCSHSRMIYLNIETRNTFRDTFDHHSAFEQANIAKAEGFYAIVGCYFHRIHNRIESGTTYPGGQHAGYYTGSGQEKCPNVIMVHCVATHVSGFGIHWKNSSAIPADTASPQLYGILDPVFANNLMWDAWRMTSIDKHIWQPVVRFNTFVQGHSCATMLATLQNTHAVSNSVRYNIGDRRMMQYEVSRGLDFRDNATVMHDPDMVIWAWAALEANRIPATKSNNYWGVDPAEYWVEGTAYNSPKKTIGTYPSEFDTDWGTGTSARIGPDSMSNPSQHESTSDPTAAIATVLSNIRSNAGTTRGAGNIQRVGPLWRKTEWGF